MAKKDDDPGRDFDKDFERILQRIEVQKEQALFASLKAVGTKADDEDIWLFIAAARGLGVRNGMSVTESRDKGDELIAHCLDNGWFDEYLNVKD